MKVEELIAEIEIEINDIYRLASEISMIKKRVKKKNS